MFKSALVFLVGAATFLSSQKLKNEDLGIFVSSKAGLFTKSVSGFTNLDLKNTRAVFLEPNGRIGEWQVLNRGRGKTVEFDGQGRVVAGNSTQVRFEWQHGIDAEHLVAAYEWEWVGGSSTQSIVIQVVELRGDEVFITQQIEADAHGSGAGAFFNSKDNSLTVNAVVFEETDAHCCPSALSTVIFHWDGKRFSRISAKKKRTE